MGGGGGRDSHPDEAYEQGHRAPVEDEEYRPGHRQAGRLRHQRLEQVQGVEGFPGVVPRGHRRGRARVQAPAVGAVRPGRGPPTSF